MTDQTILQRKLKAAALAAAARGWHVFPLLPGTTEPAVRGWEERATTNTWRIIRCWEAGPYNVGIACCASGLRVLDLMAARHGDEPPAFGRLPGVTDGMDVLAVLLEDAGALLPVETYVVRAPDGGNQVYFTHPDEACPPSPPSPLAWHVEVRCTGAYVAAAGSVTDAGEYTVVHDAAVQPVPSWFDQVLPDPAGTAAALPQKIHPA